MKVLLITAVVAGSIPVVLGAQEVDRARELERSGDAAGARSLLVREAQSRPTDVAVLTQYAEFLDRYHDPDARAAYAKLLDAARARGDRNREAAAARRLMVLDILAGDQTAAARHRDAYHAAGGRNPAPGAAKPPAEPEPPLQTIVIPGPLRSFARMAAISSDAAPEDVLPALARNVVTNGYQAAHSNDALEQTEFLKLVHRYVSQARELERLSGASKTIVVENCESPVGADLLRILGFRMRGGCGGELVLETVNATRAFLTTDSGFPVHELEQAMRTNRPFRYPFKPTEVPVLYGAAYWLSATKEKTGADFLDAFLSEPSLCRLYLGLSKLDPHTAEELRKHVPFTRLKAFGHVLDFYGGMFEIRGGKAVVPGGARSAAAWGDLAGVPPDKGAAFFERLLTRDDGWLASFFDAMARIRGPVQRYLTEPARLKRFYAAVRGKVTSPGPARPVFRSNTDMMLLTTRLRLGPDGRPHVPGNVEVWKNLFINHPHGKYDGKLTRSAATWKDADDVIEALFGLCRKAVENEPLKIFMALSDLDRHRRRPLEPATINRLARQYRTMSSQYSIFGDAPEVSDKTILQFLDTADTVNRLRDPLLRCDVAGTLQALVGLWQIFCRQRSLPAAQSDAALASILTPFATVRGQRELFDAARNGVTVLLTSTGVKPGSNVQERLIDLLAGTSATTDAETHTQVVQEMIRILEAQRILPVQALFEMADHLEALSRGEKLNTALVNRLNSRIAEIQTPRAALTTVEKNSLGFGYWTEKHIDSQRKVNLRALIEKTSDKTRLKDSRGVLAPFLRDSLVALLYAHYAPPGAQILFTNPVFVRSHDFIGIQGANQTWRQTEIFGTGWPSNGGGRLMGSLAGLPYALAEAEQNFLVPSQTQALIWGDLVPQMILSAKVPRWWDVTPAQLHWVALHLRYGETLFAEASWDTGLRTQLLETLEAHAPPARVATVRRLVGEGRVREALEKVTPSELFHTAREIASRRADDWCDGAELRRLAADNPREINYEVISRAFGTPKPTLANSYQPELLALRTFPTLMGYSSRIMAESWESNTLFWAALADEAHLRPSQLNVRIPEWTQKLAERIFASHLEDWPAVLRSLRLVGRDVRAQAGGEKTAALQESVR